jgi:hypothetical protein
VVEPARIRVVAGALRALSPALFVIDAPALRGVFDGTDGRAAELTFTYLGASDEVAPLASGELRRQIGLALRVQDTCNAVYVMWHAEPRVQVAVSLKRNRGMTTHDACGAGGYVNVRPRRGGVPPAPAVGERHVLRAALVGRELRVHADGVLVWEGRLPPESEEIDGPAGVRTDNAAFVVEARALQRGPGPR